MLWDFSGWAGVSWARCPAGAFPRCARVVAVGAVRSSTACQPASTAPVGTAATTLLPAFPMQHGADRCLLTAIKDSRRHFIDEWVVDAYLLVSWGKLLWCWILYLSQSSLEKVSSLPFRSVLQSICYVSCRLQLISLEGSDSYIGFTHDSSREREHWGAGLILSCAPADIKELLYLISLKHLQSQRTDKYRKIQQNQTILKGKMKQKIKSPRFLKWVEVHIQ